MTNCKLNEQWSNLNSCSLNNLALHAVNEFIPEKQYLQFLYKLGTFLIDKFTILYSNILGFLHILHLLLSVLEEPVSCANNKPLTYITSAYLLLIRNYADVGFTLDHPNISIQMWSTTIKITVTHDETLNDIQRRNLISLPRYSKHKKRRGLWTGWIPDIVQQILHKY